HRDDAVARGATGCGGQHDLQRDLGRVGELQQDPALGPRRLARLLQGGRVHHLDELSELDVRVPAGELGRVAVPGRLHQHDRGVAEVLRQRPAAREQDLAHGRRQAGERGRVVGEHAVDPLVQGLFQDRCPRVVRRAEVEPAQFHVVSSGYRVGWWRRLVAVVLSWGWVVWRGGASAGGGGGGGGGGGARPRGAPPPAGGRPRRRGGGAGHRRGRAGGGCVGRRPRQVGGR